MFLGPLSEHELGPSAGEQRERALEAAIRLRDCSLLHRFSTGERRTCRGLMRRHALLWRDPAAAAFPRFS